MPISFQSLFEHVVLPRKLPGKPEADLVAIETELTSRLAKATEHLKGLANESYCSALASLLKSLKLGNLVNRNSRLTKSSLLKAFEDSGDGTVLIIHVAEQNAALLVQSHQQTGVVFEAFEISARSEEVLAAQNALIRDFPDIAVTVPTAEFDNPSFRDSSAGFLENASTESVKEFVTQTHKAGISVAETRNSVNPSLITSVFMTILEANGARAQPDIISKRVRDDVVWHDADVPWRRSPFWLVLRIAAYRILGIKLGPAIGRVYYKFLICTMFVYLMRDSIGQISLEDLHILKAKICRRLFKLQKEREAVPDADREVYDRLFTNFTSGPGEIVRSVTCYIKKQWSAHKNAIHRRIPHIPFQAQEWDLNIRLFSSFPYIQKASGVFREQQRPIFKPTVEKIPDLRAQPLTKLVAQFDSITRMEVEIDGMLSTPMDLTTDLTEQCLNCCEIIHSYMDTARKPYLNDPDQMSIFILNAFRVWVAMDRYAIKLFPLLAHFHPGIRPDMLDMLRLPLLKDMVHLHEIQQHLRWRCSRCNEAKLAIFADPSRESFSTKYFDESSTMRELMEEIAVASEAKRVKKVAEWESATYEYDQLTLAISQTTCVCTWDEEGNIDPSGCNHCFYSRKRKRMAIDVHEHYLPAPNGKDLDSQRRAVVFELCIPECLAAYRDTTWRLLSSLGHQAPQSVHGFYKLLRDYKSLASYSHTGDGIDSSVTLASRRKPFKDTHYKSARLPVNLAQVVVPHGMLYEYMDTIDKFWLNEISEKPSFRRHCCLRLPQDTPYAAIPNVSGEHEALSSSYQIVANQSKCPQNINIHEFNAIQYLFSGRVRRWISLLAELGSSNLNFSAEATTQLYEHLCWEAGPESTDDNLRDNHCIFHDDKFSRKLVEQIELKVASIASNSREANCAELLVTLTLRVVQLASADVADMALRLLLLVRRMMLQWISQLRREVHWALDEDTAQRASAWALLAILLCRRTYCVFIDTGARIDAEALRTFVEASVALQENMATIPHILPGSGLRKKIVRDVQITFRLRRCLQDAVATFSGCIGVGINTIWPQKEGVGERLFSPWTVPSDDGWIVSKVKPTRNIHGSFTTAQTVYYHLYYGHVWVDGVPLGPLPAEIRNLKILRELFGNQHLLTFPSNMPEMSHHLTATPEGHQIHIGFREGKLILRACRHDTIMELIESEKFVSDLPDALVNGCVHWLDLQTGNIEIRRQPHIWRPFRYGNFKLVFNGRLYKAVRRESFLVDSHTTVFRMIESVFRDFEDPKMILVTQPMSGSLLVELKRLQLTFTVKHGFLYCHQLGAIIDRDQDAGTWYGFTSKIVLQDNLDKSKRSIITPLGKLIWSRNGPHVTVKALNEGEYGRFTIDKTLSRLHCPPEYRLLYFKALIHAFTSFVLPDPLTLRTGTEQSLIDLRSGRSQPWQPIPSLLASLALLSGLTPKREYYPSQSRCQQRVWWDPHLTTNIQHDYFRPVVDQLFQASQRLSLLSGNGESHPVLPPELSHLRYRSSQRGRLYECRMPHIRGNGPEKPVDSRYSGRADGMDAHGSLQTFEIVRLLQEKPRSISTTKVLASKFSGCSVLLEGFNKDYIGSLDNLLSMNILVSWAPLATACQSTQSGDVYKLMFLLGPIAYAKDIDMELLRSLVAFHCFADLKELLVPQFSSFVNFEHYEKPTSTSLCARLDDDCFEAFDPEVYMSDSHGKRRSNEDLIEKIEYEKDCHNVLCSRKGAKFAGMLILQWPCESPSIVGIDKSEYAPLDCETALDRIQVEWSRLAQNRQFSLCLDKMQSILTAHHIDNAECSLPSPVREHHCSSGNNHALYEVPTIRDLMSLGLPRALGSPTIVNVRDYTSGTKTGTGGKIQEVWESQELGELSRILEALTAPDCPVRKKYACDLQQSLVAARTASSNEVNERAGNPTMFDVNLQIEQALQQVRKSAAEIDRALKERHGHFEWLLEGGLWPRLNPLSLLEQLRSIAKLEFGTYARDSLINYGVMLTGYQRLLRIRFGLLKKNDRVLSEEMQHKGHSNWSPAVYPDWLLLEIDGNFLIRDVQVEVALATISPICGSNSVLQMNMGQGKTSVIMPMVAAVLADQSALARLIVPTALLLQTAQILQEKLGGLLGRQVKHVPFSRKSSTSADSLRTYLGIHKRVAESGGVLLTLPEHVLSFKLSGIQCLSDGRLSEAKAIMDTQSWLTQKSRDVLDECDVILAVKTQLIYPSGSQVAVDGHPNRWTTVQTLLQLVLQHIKGIREQFPHSLRTVCRQGTEFPMMHFLRVDAETAMVSRIVDDICDGRTALLPRNALADEDTVRRFITEESTSPRVLSRLTQMFADDTMSLKTCFLLRGLLVHGILLLCLKKRWNVQYGLHPNRDPIAVPFNAKGVPSDQSEWGHPDVAILFTTLAFYYRGLTMPQVRQSLQHVLNSDDPALEFEKWVHACASLPTSFRQWNVINSDDVGQVLQLWRYLRHNMAVIDYFLNMFVFPAHAKQFALKLQASGWDIPALCKDSSRMNHQTLTTGFSGTNDNRTMLPLMIRQQDLPGLAHTNAEVLTYLLQPRNREYVYRIEPQATEKDLLKGLYGKQIRILIDAGAHVLEMENRNLIREWLDVDKEARAGVYFDANSRPCVSPRVGRDGPLLGSHYADDLENCLIYLDEQHTRGTDLKLPLCAHGALTLGLGQTKDYTLQAAMRLRQLGSSQRVTFIASFEVHRNILDTQQKPENAHLDSADVISWLLEQTCIKNTQLQPLYIAQGIDWCKRMNAAWSFPDYLSSSRHRNEFMEVVRQPEQQSLEQFYKPSFRVRQAEILRIANPAIGGFVKQLRSISQSGAHNIHDSSSAMDEVEQEREVEFQVEEVRETEKPTHYAAKTFPGLHATLLGFVKTGVLPSDQGLEHVLTALARTEIGKKHGVNALHATSKFYISAEFSQTIKLTKNRCNDNYLRSVQWILWSSISNTAIIIIPEEAEHLIPILRGLQHDARAHLIVYNTPVTKPMLPFDRLTYYSLPALPPGWSPPSLLSIELGLFSGRLYFAYDDYEPLLRYLDPSVLQSVYALEQSKALQSGIASDVFRAEYQPLSTPQKENARSTPQHKDKPQSNKESPAARVRSRHQPLGPRPLNFLREWLALKRSRQDLTHTPMGYICDGRQLKPDHPFFIKDKPLEIAEGLENLRAKTAAAQNTTAPKRKDDESDNDSDLDIFEDAVDSFHEKVEDEEVKKALNKAWEAAEQARKDAEEAK